LKNIVFFVAVWISVFGGNTFGQDFLSEKFLKLKPVMEQDTVKIYYTNLAKVGFMIHFNSFHSKNIDVSKAKNKNLLAKPSAARSLLVSLPITDIHKSSDINYDYTPAYGYINAGQFSLSRDIIYLLPYKKQESYVVGQGYLGKFSHQNLYAIDFDLPEHTEVHAARGGEVVEVINKYTASGLTRDFEDKANEVVILHEDGSYAMYSHFQYNGVQVHTGQLVSAGDFLGFSGHTGLASGPHLHFCVYVPTESGVKSAPTKFYIDTPGHSDFLGEHKKYPSI